jgi:hypothetical protein
MEKLAERIELLEEKLLEIAIPEHWQKLTTLEKS